MEIWKGSTENLSKVLYEFSKFKISITIPYFIHEKYIHYTSMFDKSLLASIISIVPSCILVDYLLHVIHIQTIQVSSV